jgi:4-amino-4-deoxy-L-arabinose transferase-like glycosyltransferase
LVWPPADRAAPTLPLAGPASAEAAHSPAAHPRLVRLLLHPIAGPTLVVLTCLAVFFAGLGAAPLLDPDEGRHAEVAREMLVGEGWLAPTLDFRPYHDKPALFYWLAAAALAAFGVEAWAARLPSAVAACLGVVATVWWGSRFLGRLTGMMAGLILATSGIYMGLGRFVSVDMTFAFCLDAAFFWGSAWVLSPAQRRPPAWPAFILLGLATLAKGPLALVLAASTFGCFFLHPARMRRLKGVRLRRGLLILAAVAGSWYAACAVLAPGYLAEFFWRDNVARFVSGAGGHSANPFAYLYWLPLVFFPWSLYLPMTMHRLQSRRAPPAIEFCVVWFATGLVFLSTSQGKLATYLLPLLPPLALLTADALGATLRRGLTTPLVARNHRAAPLAAAAFLVVAAVLGALFLDRYAPQSLARAALALIGIPPLYLAARAAARGRADAGPAVLFGLCLLCTAVGYSIAAPVLRAVYSLEPAAALLAGLPADARIVSLRSRAHSLRFYVERDIAVADSPAEAAARLAQPAFTVLLTKRSLIEPLRREFDGELFLWWTGQRKKVLLANRPRPVTAGAADATAGRPRPIRLLQPPAAENGVAARYGR